MHREHDWLAELAFEPGPGDAKGLFGSLPRRAWLAPTSQAAEGQAGRMQGVHVWLLGCA